MWVQSWSGLGVQFCPGFLCGGCCAWVLMRWYLGCWSARGLRVSCIQFQELLVRLAWFGCSGGVGCVLGGIPGGLQSVVLVHWVSGVIWVPGGGSLISHHWAYL